MSARHPFDDGTHQRVMPHHHDTPRIARHHEPLFVLAAAYAGAAGCNGAVDAALERILGAVDPASDTDTPDRSPDDTLL